MSELLDRLAPWLIELGNWIFGGLIGFNVVILGAVLTMVPVDDAVKIATAASALALPPSAVGLVILRLLADLRSIRQARAAAPALEEVKADIDSQAPAHRRNELVRRYAYLLMILSVLLTLAGITAALWHIAWWIGVVFLLFLGASVATIPLAAAQLKLKRS